MSIIVRETNCVGTTMRMTSAPSTASAMLVVALSPSGTLYPCRALTTLSDLHKQGYPGWSSTLHCLFHAGPRPEPPPPPPRYPVILHRRLPPLHGNEDLKGKEGCIDFGMLSVALSPSGTLKPYRVCPCHHMSMKKETLRSWQLIADTDGAMPFLLHSRG